MNLRKFALFLGLLLASACSSGKHYELKGQVLAVNREKQEILVDHEEIVGYMMPMTMPYKVQSSGMLDNLGAGDLITAQLDVKDSGAVITAITKTGNKPANLPKPSPLSGAGLELLKDGQEVPNVAFVDQDSKDLRFSDIRDGRAMVLTFMYTKCPMPTYCPMMDRNFVAVQKAIKATPALRDKVRLLSVSFDTQNDTPPVLKAHANGLDADPSVWTFVTGTPDAINGFAATFGLTLMRGEGKDPDEIGHTLRTAIVDRDGKLVKTYNGNEWTPDQIIADLNNLR